MTNTHVTEQLKSESSIGAACGVVLYKYFPNFFRTLPNISELVKKFGRVRKNPLKVRSSSVNNNTDIYIYY